MSDLIRYLRSFNRKERFSLLQEALGANTFCLDDDFRERLGGVVDLSIPAESFVAMDYHLDWLQMALYLTRTPDRPRYIPKKAVLGDGQKDINANQMDVDLLVAFDEDATTHLVLLEAKLETGWTNRQMGEKATRLDQIFPDPPAAGVRPYFVLLSPNPPRRLEVGKWPRWMRPDRKPVWMPLPKPPNLRKVTRCTGDGRVSAAGGFLRIDP